MKKIICMFIVMLALISNCFAEQNFTCCVTKGEWVWVRDQPSKEGNQIGTIRYGYNGVIHEIKDGYARITSTYGIEGWVDVFYLDMPIKEEIWVVNTTGPVNKRETPDGRYMTKIHGGARISVLGWRYSKEGELWAKVYKGGYVKAEFLSKAE